MASTYHIVGLGELLWDVFPEHRCLGGAPANVAYHACVLGDHGAIATRVGNDPLGDEAVALLAERGVDIRAVQRDARRATGAAVVSVSATGEPTFEIAQDSAWTAPTWTPEWQELLSQADVLCFGSLLCAQRGGREVLQRSAGAVSSTALRLLDLNLRPPLTDDTAIDAALSCANALKLSESELAALAAQLDVAERDAPAHLLQTRGFRAIAVTRGARGSLLYTPQGCQEHPGCTVDAGDAEPNHDSVGAGDAFTAALAHHLVRAHHPARANAAANRYAAFVASRAGAMPAVPASVVNEVVGPTKHVTEQLT